MRFCICGGCSNSDLLSDHLRFHSFPDRRKDGAGFRAWVHFVQLKRKDFFFASVTKYTFICAAHFRPEDYVSGDMMEFKMGFRSEKRVRLKAGVVPSIHAAPAAASGSATGGSEDHGPVRDSTIRKRELCTLLGNTARFEATDAPTASEDSEQEAVASLASQPESVRHFGSQCHIRPPYRSSAIQVQTQTVSVGTQTELCVSSIPLPSPVQTENESSSVSRDQPDDRSWSEVEEMSVSSYEEESEPQQGSQWDFGVADKLIVCLTQLMALFTICPACCGETHGNVEQQQGTFVQIKQVCAACGFERVWQNQPVLHRNMPACNLMLSGAIHFSGCMATQTLRMLKLFGLQCFTANTFFRHQRLYTIPTIVQAWKNEQAGIVSQLKEMGGGLILSGDCRSDSPGHCAKYGTYTVIEDRINRVLDLQLVQSSEVPSSNWFEAKRSISQGATLASFSPYYRKKSPGCQVGAGGVVP